MEVETPIQLARRKSREIIEPSNVVEKENGFEMHFTSPGTGNLQAHMARVKGVKEIKEAIKDHAAVQFANVTERHPTHEKSLIILRVRLKNKFL